MPTSKTIVLNERPAKDIDPQRTFKEETRTVGEPGKGEVLVKVRVCVSVCWREP